MGHAWNSYFGQEREKSFSMRKALLGLALMATTFCMANIDVSYAAPSVIGESEAIEKSRISYLMTGTDGKMYNLYIIGENEKFYGAKNTWKKTDYDQVYSANSYWAYISEMNDSNAILQDVNLFGKRSSNHPEYINRTNPSYMGGIYVIKGVQGNPDILISACQPTYSFVTYRIFVIKDGALHAMRAVNDISQETMTSLVGIHRKPYGLDDGTFAFPWFRRGTWRQDGTKVPGGNFTSVYMADFTNLLLIHAYTYKE